MTFPFTLFVQGVEHQISRSGHVHEGGSQARNVCVSLRPERRSPLFPVRTHVDYAFLT
jgi:hypothetical protein